MTESYSHKFISQLPKHTLTPEEVDYCALEGGFRIDPNNNSSPALLRKFAKNPTILRKMTAPTEEHVYN